MSGKTLRRLIVLLGMFLLIAGAVWWAQSKRQPVEYEMAYVFDPSAIVWNSNAQVRQPVVTLHYGDHVKILRRSGDRAEVRADSGSQGWIDESSLMDADLWQQAAALLARAKTLPVQALGHTRTISNVRLTAGRDGARIFQFGRNEPVAVLERAVRPVPVETSGEANSGADNLPKMEDWLLVSRSPEEPAKTPSTEAPAQNPTIVSAGIRTATPASPAVPMAGWVLGRFIDLDPPAPIPDYLNASNVRAVAWVVVSTLTSGDGPKPQYLVAGTTGGEGQPCDFTLLRYYTWGAARQRYETAFIQNDMCGRMPILVSTGANQSEFRFADPMQNGAEQVYQVRQTTVRRVSGAGPARGAKR